MLWNVWILRPNTIEFEVKAKMLHEDITKHELQKELARLQNHINHYNEKEWLLEFNECLDNTEELKSNHLS